MAAVSAHHKRVAESTWLVASAGRGRGVRRCCVLKCDKCVHTRYGILPPARAKAQHQQAV
eukprot:6607407-Prymnesium_polylepis.1